MLSIYVVGYCCSICSSLYVAPIFEYLCIYYAYAQTFFFKQTCLSPGKCQAAEDSESILLGPVDGAEESCLTAQEPALIDAFSPALSSSFWIHSSMQTTF